MIAVVVRVVLAFASSSPADLANGIRADAPGLLDADAALENATAAVIAGAAFDVSPELLLSIAHHESRYQHGARTAEAAGKTSCGVMTPVPMRDAVLCDLATRSPLLGYLHGAEHLRTWIGAARGNLRTALLGYAGGYRMIRACALGPIPRERGGRIVDLCRTPEVFAARAARIRRRPATS